MPRITKQIETLSPSSVGVCITDRATGEDHPFTQQALSLRATGLLIDYLASLLVDPANGLDLDELFGTDVSSSAGVARFIGKLTGLGPTVLARVLAIILGSEDEDWLAENITPGQAIRVLRTFIQQNDVPELMRDFFALQQEWKAVMDGFTKGK